jgi:hypothetical protein
MHALTERSLCCPGAAANVVNLEKPVGHSYKFEELKAAVEQHKPAVLFLCQVRAPSLPRPQKPQQCQCSSLPSNSRAMVGAVFKPCRRRTGGHRAAMPMHAMHEALHCHAVGRSSVQSQDSVHRAALPLHAVHQR